MHEYLKWNEQTITDFSDENINRMYNDGYVFTRKGKGVMQQTRSLRVDLSKFELTSENRRVHRRVIEATKEFNIDAREIPDEDYHWSIGKLAKDFYETKFGKGTFSANKVKELLTDKKKSSFNQLLIFHFAFETDCYDNAGYCIAYANKELLHYSYPFYKLHLAHEPQIPYLGMAMMVKTIEWTKEMGFRYIYLGSAQRPTDIYKLQFKGLEWFDGTGWQKDTAVLKDLLQQS